MLHLHEFTLKPIMNQLLITIAGSFAVISLMVAQVCEREAAGLLSQNSSPSPAPVNTSSTSTSPSAGNGLWSPIDAVKVEIAVTLAFLVGIFQVSKV